MAAEPKSSPFRILPYVMAAAFAVLGLRPLRDPDVWWHLRLGEFIVRRHSVPAHDPFSDITSHPWVTHEWLSELLMFLSFDLAGYKGVSVLRALLMLALALMVARSCLARSSGPIASVVTAVALIAVWPGTGERPQLVSFLLFALLGPRLHQSMAIGARLWPLIPLVLVWSNLHGFWSLAVVLFGACSIGAVFDSRPERRLNVAVRHGAVAIGAVLAAAVNPNGFATLLAPFRVAGYSAFVTEWAPPSLLNPFQLAAFVLLAVVVAGWARAGRPTSWLTCAYVLAAAVIGFVYSRDVPIAAILLAPLAAEAAMAILGRSRDVAPWRRTPRMAAGVALGAATVAAAGIWLTAMPGIAPQAPFEVSRRLNALPGRANVITEYDLGAWLLWSARDSQPAIDGRTELYGVDYVRRYFDAQELRPGWRTFVAEGNFQAAWLRKETPLITGLKDVLGWRQVFSDGSTVLLVPPPVS